MKRMTQLMYLGLLLSISTLAFAGHDHDRNHRQGYYDNGYHYDRHNKRHHSRHRYHRHARRHSHHGRYCHDWHPRGYVVPRVVYEYGNPGVVIVYEAGAGIYIGGGR